MDSYVKWQWDEETNKNIFYRCSRDDDARTLIEIITEEEYYKEVGY